MSFEITADKIRNNLEKRLIEEQAELRALKQVKINTSHKTLSNRAISGDGATIGDYLGINKALYLSYIVDYPDGHKKYERIDIIAYSYTDEAGAELGANGILRISRTVTPKELAETVKGIIESKQSFIKELKSEHKRAETIARKHNELVKKINQFNDSISYASEARL